MKISSKTIKNLALIPIAIGVSLVAYKLLHDMFGGTDQSVTYPYGLVTSILGAGFVLILLSKWKKEKEDKPKENT